MALSGLYSADYYRKAVHKIKVDDNVKEVLVGPDTFEVSKKFGKILKRFVNTDRKAQSINLDLPRARVCKKYQHCTLIIMAN